MFSRKDGGTCIKKQNKCYVEKAFGRRGAKERQGKKKRKRTGGVERDEREEETTRETLKEK